MTIVRHWGSLISQLSKLYNNKKLCTTTAMSFQHINKAQGPNCLPKLIWAISKNVGHSKYLYPCFKSKQMLPSSELVHTNNSNKNLNNICTLMSATSGQKSESSKIKSGGSSGQELSKITSPENKEGTKYQVLKNEIHLQFWLSIQDNFPDLVGIFPISRLWNTIPDWDSKYHPKSRFY